MEAQTDDQNLIFQIYLNKDRAGTSASSLPLANTHLLGEASERLLEKVEDLGCKAIMFTVDAPVSGNRTMDQRAKGVVEQVRLTVDTLMGLADVDLQAPPSAKDDKNKSAAPVGIAQAISGYQDDNLVWDDIAFIRVSRIGDCFPVGADPLEDAEKHKVANHGQG